MDRRWWCNKSGRSVTDGRRPRNACTIPSAQLALSINCSNPLRTQSSIFLSLNAVPSAVLTILPPGLTFRAWQMLLNSGNPRGRRVGKWDNPLVGILLSHSHSPHCPRLGTAHVAIMQWGGHFYSYRCRARPIFSAPNRLRHCVKVVLILNEVRDRFRIQTRGRSARVAAFALSLAAE